MSQSGTPILLLFILCALPQLLKAQSELSPSDTAALVAKLQRQRLSTPALTTTFREEKTTRLATQPIITTGTLAFEAPDKFRREAKGANPSLTVSNGARLWVYMPNRQRVELYQLGKRPFIDDAVAALTAGLNFEHVENYYEVKAFRETEGSYKFELTPRTVAVKRLLRQVSVLVDADYRILRTEAITAKGDRVLTTYAIPRPATLPASTFEFSPPANIPVVEPLGH